MQPSAKMHYHPPKLHWGWECSCSQVNATNPLQKCMHHPKNGRRRCGWQTCCCWVNAMLCKNACGTLQNVQGLGRSSPAPGSMQLVAEIHPSPPKMQGECSCSQVDSILRKNAHITPKNAGGGRQVETTLGKVVSLPCKSCLGSERHQHSDQCNALQKYLNSPKNGVGFCIPPSSPLDAPVQTKPPQTQECITGVGARALLLIAGFKPKKKAGKQCKNMIF